MPDLSTLQITDILVGLIMLCGTLGTGLFTLVGVLYGTSIQRNKLHAETQVALKDQTLRSAQIETEIQSSLVRLNNELEDRIKQLKVEIQELRDEQRGLRDDKRILEERFLDVQRKYDAILLEYQELTRQHAEAKAENGRLKAQLEEQRGMLEALRKQLDGTL